MATPELHLLTEAEFRQSRYGDVTSGVTRPATFIAQAEAIIESYIDRKLHVDTYTEVHRCSQSYIFVRQYPVREIISIRKRSTPRASWEVLDVDDARVRYADLPVIEYLGTSLVGQEVEITYEAGYEPIPEDIKSAVILQTTLQASVDIEVYGVGDGRKPGILYIQDIIRETITPYKRFRRIH